MLDSFKRSYENNSFSTEKSCDVCLEVIETYMQILMPAFQFTLIVQKMSSTIGEVVPLLNIMISKWKRAKLNSNYKIPYDYVPLTTSPDGNCLYNAVSLYLSGVQNDYFKLRLASLFIIFEFVTFFRYFIISKGFNFTFENFILYTAKIGIWGNSLNMIVLSFVTLRSINFYESESDPYQKSIHTKVRIILNKHDSNLICMIHTCKV